MENLNEISYENTMIIWWLDIQGSYKCLMQSKNTTGGQVYEYLSRTTVCPRMRNMSTIQDRQKPNKTCVYASREGKINLTICKLLHNWLTTSGQIWFYPCHGRQRECKGGNPHPNNKNSDARRSGTTSFGQPIQTIWLTRQNDVRQRTSICCHDFQGTLETSWNQIKLDDGLSSTNWWSYWTSQSRNQSLFVDLLLCSSYWIEKTHYRL